MISAKVIADSISAYDNSRLTTFEIVVHRYVLAEVNTHKMLSKNSASSRAIPLKAAIEEIYKNTAYPVVWRKNQAGMVAGEDMSQEEADKAKGIWTDVRNYVTGKVQELSDLGLHKQWANRLQENFTYQKIIISGTEWDNFFWLRICPTAQPEINELAERMLEAYNASVPEILYEGEWHTPYVKHTRGPLSGHLYYEDADGNFISLEDALKVSASCCAQVSYRKLDDSMDKAIDIFNKLNLTDSNEDRKSHSSPTEHSGTPIRKALLMNNRYLPFTWEEGVTHVTRDGRFGSGNFYGFKQYRHTFKNESCKSHPKVIKHDVDA